MRPQPNPSDKSERKAVRGTFVEMEKEKVPWTKGEQADWTEGESRLRRRVGRSLLQRTQ